MSDWGGPSTPSPPPGGSPSGGGPPGHGPPPGPGRGGGCLRGFVGLLALALVLIVGGALLLSALGVVDLPFLGSRPPPPAPT